MSAALTQSVAPDACFSHVLVGLDDSPSGLAAACQGSLLTAPEGTLELLAAYEVDDRREGPPPIFLDARRNRDRARGTVRDALRSLPPNVTPSTTTIAPAPLSVALLEELQRAADTLVVVAAMPDSTAVEILQAAPCSVLVTRPDAATPPREVVVGLDGSPESALAYVTGCRIARRFGARLTALVAFGGDPPDAPAVEQITHRSAERSGEDAATALIAVSKRADLLIVGNRGLHGVDRLGSVAERVALRAACSVLVTRRS